MSKPLFSAELGDLIAELYAPTPASPAEWTAIKRDLAYLGRRSEPDGDGRTGGHAAERRPSVG